MPNGVTLQAQSQATAHADLGFVLGTKISGVPMAMRESELAQLVESIAANRFVLPRNRQTGARITERGTAIVEVHGILIDRAPYIGSFWGLSSYERLAEQCRRIKTNDDVKCVVLDLDTPGGMVLGIEACGRAIADLAEKKPVYALANNMACSAGYWLACVADEVSVTPNGELGNIGVISSRVSYAEKLERDGITARVFSAGAAKSDARMISALTDGEAAEAQYQAERMYGQFIRHVAGHRGMSEDAVRNTDARCFWGDDAVAAGLADRTETLEELVERVEKSAARVKPRRKPSTDKSSKAGLAPAERKPATSPPPDDSEPTAGKPKGARTMSTPAADEARADLSAMITAAIAAGRQSAQAAAPAAPAAAAAAAQPAAASDADRIFAILECDEAKDRPALARSLAKNGKLTVDEARALLAAAAVEKPAAATGDKAALADALAVQMAKPGNSAGVKPEAGGGDSKPRSFGQFAREKTAAKKAS